MPPKSCLMPQRKAVTKVTAINPEYIIPVYHPLVNHFPIAFLILAGGTGLIWLITGSRFWRYTTLLLTGAGALGAIIAEWTGETMAEFSRGRPIVKLLVEQHEELAVITIFLSVAAFLLLLGAICWANRKHNPTFADSIMVRVIVVAFVIASAILVGWTGHVGGTMTWGEEIGLLWNHPSTPSLSVTKES